MAKEPVCAENPVLSIVAGKVAHEVGNLLNNIGLTIIALKSQPLDKAGMRAVEILEKDSVRVRGFIKSFLRFARKPDPQLQKLNAAAIVQEILVIYQPRAEEKGIRFELSWSKEIPEIDADAHLLRQVFDDLIRNSLEAMMEPGSITITGRLDGGCLHIIVEDTGPGVQADVLDWIFHPFYTTKGNQGAGLGLSICKSIVEAHRGTIECSSEFGKGTVFSLHLPLLESNGLLDLATRSD